LFGSALLGEISRVWECFRDFAVAAFFDPDAVPEVIFSIQVYGDLINTHPQLICIYSDGWFSKESTFHPMPEINPEKKLPYTSGTGCFFEICGISGRLMFFAGFNHCILYRLMKPNDSLFLKNVEFSLILL